ncbi:ferredoxin [Halioxenophilus aromaticivorans]|uniref:Ferredoxin n=1 Tax=Halioxenophilus aromaticivorans TaxID=1306992 RepID=A0AAV3U625_9ALTE
MSSIASQSEKKRYTVTADIPNCCGYGLCSSLCPEVYRLDENGIVYLATDTIDESLFEAAQEGAESCPAEVLQVTLIEE